MTTKRVTPVWTVGDQVRLLIDYLKHAHESPNTPTDEKNAALYEDENLNALVQLSKHPDQAAYIQTLNDIAKVTGLEVQLIKDIVNKRAAELDSPKKKGRKDKGYVPGQDDVAAARNILSNGDPIQSHVDYSTKTMNVEGGDKLARVVTMASYSAFMGEDDRLHIDALRVCANGENQKRDDSA